MTARAKKWIAAFAALQILIYHCWIPVFSFGTAVSAVVRFLVAATYPGVDLFFFISAYSLASRPVEDYWGFIKNRALKLLPLFFIALIAGRFLWFLPSIMIMYLAFPPLYIICRRRPTLSFGLLFLGWAALTLLILGVLRPAQDVGIFLFRIPVIILGAYAVKLKDKLTPRMKWIAGLLLAAGLALIYRFGYLNRLNVPFRGTFYLTGIPVTLGTVLIIDRLAAGRPSRVIEAFGSLTLELYFAQMVLGTLLVTLAFRLTGSRLATNALVLTVLIAAAAAIKWLSTRLRILTSPKAVR